jgi:hypothetical protein
MKQSLKIAALIALFLFSGCGMLSDRNLEKVKKTVTTPPNFMNPTLERRVVIGDQFEDDWPRRKNEIWFKFHFFSFEF